jgi:Dna[CI] antecedent, DciA
VDKLGNILPRIVRKQPGGHRLMGSQVVAAFRSLLGPDIARLCDEVELRAGILLVTTSSPAESILVRLNRPELGRKVKTLRVRIGRRAQ